MTPCPSPKATAGGGRVVRVIHNSIKLSNQPTYWPEYMFIYIMHKNTALGPIGFTQSLD